MPTFTFLKRPQVLLPLFAGCCVVLILGYFQIRLGDERSVNTQLSEVLNDALKEKEQLQASVADMEAQLREKEQRLQHLGDAAALRSSLDNAQKIIEQMNIDMAKVNNERISLQNININLTSKLQGTTRELMRSVEGLKAAREELSRSDLVTLKKKAEDLDKSLGLKDQDLAGLKNEIKRLQQLNQELAQKNVDIEKNMAQLRSTLSGAAKSGGRPADSAGVNKAVVELKETLAAKNEQIQRLQDDLAQLGSASPASGSQRKISELLARNTELNQRLSELQDQLSAARQEPQPGKSRLSGQDPGAKEQMSRLSELLVKKELEMDASKKEAMEMREKYFALQSKLASLESVQAQNKNSADRIRDLESKALTLQARAGELQESLAQRTAMAETLQKNLTYLTQQLARKDDDFRSIESKYSTIDSRSKEELDRQKARYDEANMLYNSLKGQIAQFTEALNLKEAELDQRKKESSVYREEIAALRSRTESLERDLLEAKDRQKKTLDDLVASVKLNTVLQDRIMTGSAAAVSSKGANIQQQKADDLKRRIEIMLEPQVKQAP